LAVFDSTVLKKMTVPTILLPPPKKRKIGLQLKEHLFIFLLKVNKLKFLRSLLITGYD